MFGFFPKKSVGIDISDGSIEVAEITRSKILSLGRVVLAPGIVERGRIKDSEKLAHAFTGALLGASPRPIKTRKAFFAMPESQVYSRVVKIDVSIKSLTREERVRRMQEETRKNIPLEAGDLLFTYQILSEGSSGTELALLAASRTVTAEWQQFFAHLNIKIRAFDVETLAIVRSIFGRTRGSPLCLVDIGTRMTSIAVIDASGLRYAHSLGIGGASFTKDVAQALQIREEEAEDRKILLGVTEKNQKGFFVLIKALQPIVKEITTAFRVYQRSTGNHVGQVIFVGGASHLPGLLNYFSENLSLPVAFGRSHLPLKKQDADVTHLEAVGIALKAWADADPSFPASALDRTGRSLFMLPHFHFPSVLSRVTMRQRAVLGISILLFFGGVFVYLLVSRDKAQTAPLPDLAQPATGRQTYEHAFDFRVELALTPGAYTSERIHARIIEITGMGEDLLIRSLVEAEQMLKSGEKLARAPLSQSAEAVRWVAYTEDDLIKKVIGEVEKFVAGRSIQYQLLGIEDGALMKKEGDIALLNVRARISSSELITETVLPQLQQPALSPNINEKRVRIRETETGYLNVRDGPGISHKLLFRVNPGETHILLEKEGDWAKIVLPDGRSGWVSRQHIEEI